MRVKRLLFVIMLAVVCQIASPVSAVAEDTAAEETVKLPIIMYHSILKDARYHGKYVVSPDVLEEDLQYLSELGYETVSLKQLKDYVSGVGDLPEKPVMITFDDGFLNNMTYALPLLEKYDMCAVISVIGEYTEIFSIVPDPRPSYAYLSWNEIAELLQSGRIEIGNHTYGMHSNDSRIGSAKIRGESDEAYVKLFTMDTLELQTALVENCGYLPMVYTYPFGSYCEESEALLRAMGFDASFSCKSVVNKISRDPDCLFLLGRFNRPSGTGTYKFMKSMDIK